MATIENSALNYSEVTNHRNAEQSTALKKHQQGSHQDFGVDDVRNGEQQGELRHRHESAEGVGRKCDDVEIVSNVNEEDRRHAEYITSALEPNLHISRDQKNGSQEARDDDDRFWDEH